MQTQVSGKLPEPIPHDRGVFVFHCRFWRGHRLIYEFKCLYFPDEESGKRFVPQYPLTRKERDEISELKMTIHNPQDVNDLAAYSRRYHRETRPLPGDRWRL